MDLVVQIGFEGFPESGAPIEARKAPSGVVVMAPAEHRVGDGHPPRGFEAVDQEMRPGVPGESGTGTRPPTI